MDNPLNIRGLDHVVLRVLDLDRSLHFYRDILGCPVEKHQEQIGLIQLRAGSALIDLVPVEGVLGAMGGAPPGEEGHNMDHFCLQLGNFDADSMGAWLGEHGVHIGEIGTRYGALGSGPSMYIQDPDGNTVELKGPPEAN